MSEHQRKTLFHVRRQTDDRDELQKDRRNLRWNANVRYGMLAVTTVILTLLFPHSSFIQDRFEVGSIWTGDTVRAPFAFPLYKDEASYQRDVRRAGDSVVAVYVPTRMTAQRMEDTLKSVAQAIAVSETPPPFLSDKAKAFVTVIPEGEQRVSKMLEIAEALATSLSGPYGSGVINRSKSTITHENIAIRRNDVYEEMVPISALYDSLGVLQTVEATVSRILNPEEAAFAVELFQTHFMPTFQYRKDLTESARANAVASVPKTQGIVTEGEVIVATGQRISEAIQVKLESLERSRQLHDVDEQPWRQMLGNLLHVIVLLGLTGLYFYNFRQRIFHDNLQLGIILVAVIVVGVMAFVTMMIQSPLPIEFLIMIPFLSTLLSILYDSRTAFYMTVMACFIIAGIRGTDYMIVFASLTAGVLAIYTVRDIRNRTQLFRSMGFSMLGFTMAILALGLERGDSLSSIGLRLGFAAINSLVSPVLTFGALLLIENLFEVATDLKLLEYDNLNHPLLRALADKAPGTYQHTLTIARLAESAASAIGANPLLAKVGSYYHDVGKIAKAEYFVENQMQMGNKHDRIKPEMSARIIRNHVLDGMELARQYKLPQRIIDFIPMHHGTTMIQYFLDKARETNPEVNENDFRYPGPLPYSRETAIVMLADAVEATTRALPNPTPKAIEETIDRAIKKRFSEGQLDHCDLTLADLNKIKNAFLRNLIGMSHPRIQYKSDAPPPSAAPKEKDGDGSKRSRQEPMIPYIDDAFGNIDAEFPSVRPAEKK